MKSEINDKWSIISKKISGETNTEDDLFFDDWIIHDENKDLFETIERIKLDCDYEVAMSIKEQVYKETFDKIFSRKRYRPGRMRFFLSVAAGVALLVGLFSVFSYYSNVKRGSATVFSCSKGISKITLPDSTFVTLNAGSKISYNQSDFNKKYRNVTLTGEAFFVVKHDSEHPFIVSTEKINIKVLGTVFNVNAYPGKNEITTSLISGSVELTGKNNDMKMKLAPGQASTYNKNTDQMNLYTFNPDDVQDWMYLIFYKESFQSVCVKLSQRFDRDVELRNIKIENKLFTGKFVNNESLPDILDILRINVPFSYRTEGRKVIIY